MANNGEASLQNGDSSMESTYRAEGLSIGQDYLRYYGTTLSSALSPSSFVVEDIVGRGACSVVQRARHSQTKELVALKVFHSIRNNASKAEMLGKEMQVLCSLNCNSLVKLVGGFFAEDSVTMVLEYMDQGSLEDLLRPFASRGRGFDQDLVASIAYQMLNGIAFLHNENILHRDVKPANVLVNSNGYVKLTDFGIATKTQKDQLNQTVVGTTRYLSPERLGANPYGAKSDVWSLGLVLIECASGINPFEGITSIVELWMTIKETPVEDLIPKEITGSLRQLLVLCLKKRPEARPPARALLSSPLFKECGIRNLCDAVSIIRKHIAGDMRPKGSGVLTHWQNESNSNIPTPVKIPGMCTNKQISSDERKSEPSPMDCGVGISPVSSDESTASNMENSNIGGNLVNFQRSTLSKMRRAQNYNQKSVLETIF